MKIQVISGAFSVCKLKEETPIHMDRPFTFYSRTDEELSLVCRSEERPEETVAHEEGWSLLRVVGPLDLTLVGILSRLSTVLAEANVSIFALSTFDTDYLLVHTVQLKQALNALLCAGYVIAGDVD